MKILFVSYYGWLFGGGETYLFDLADELKSQGNDVRIFSSNDGEGSKKINYSYSFKVSKTKVGRALSSLFNPRSLREFKKVLKDFNPDVVHINSIAYEVSPSITFALKQFPTILFVHAQTMFTVDKNLPTLKKIYAHMYVLTNKFLLRNVDLFLTPSRSLAKTIPKNFKQSRITAFGIKTMNYSPLKNYSNLLFIGRLEKEKGVDVLLDAMKSIVNYDPNVNLNIIGSGGEYKNIKSLIKKLNLNKNVKLLGYLERDKIAHFLKVSTLLIIPSVYEEPFGIVGIEALSVGRPVVGSNIGGISEWLNSSCGVLVKPNDPKLLAEVILKQLSNKKRLDDLSKKAHQESIKYSMKSHSIKISSLYEEVIRNYLDIY